MMSKLEVVEISKQYVDFVAVDSVSFTLEETKCLAIIGPNGAGKSTLFGLIGGQIGVTRGKILLDNQIITSEPPWSRARRGLVRTFQTAQLFENETVYGCVVLAAMKRKESVWNRGRDPYRDPKLQRKVVDLIDLVNLGGSESKRVGNLTNGEKKRLEVAMLIGQAGKVLVLDEPTAGMTEEDIESVVDVLSRIRRNNDEVSILLSSHDMDVIRRLADEVVVMVAGSVLCSGDPDSVRSDPRVLKVYLGGGMVK